MHHLILRAGDRPPGQLAPLRLTRRREDVPPRYQSERALRLTLALRISASKNDSTSPTCAHAHISIR